MQWIVASFTATDPVIFHFQLSVAEAVATSKQTTWRGEHTVKS